MIVLQYILLVGILVCAIAAPLCRRLLNTVIVYTALSLQMAVLWSLLQTPDLAITEAAVGAGVTSILFFLTLKKIHALKDDKHALSLLTQLENAYKSENKYLSCRVERTESLAAVGISVETASHDIMMMLNKGIDELRSLYEDSLHSNFGHNVSTNSSNMTNLPLSVFTNA